MRFSLGLCSMIIGCGANAAPPQSTATPHDATPAAVAPDQQQSSPDPAATSTKGETSAPEPAPPITRLTWRRELPHPATSLAVGTRRVAALGDSVKGDAWLFDGKAWKDVPLPEHLRPRSGERDEVRIFFGRDDMPRILGARFDGDQATPVYLRHRPPAGWIAERNETGRLLGPPAAPLFGVLGHDDPEVVCKLGDQCIVKRLTGWSVIPAPKQRLRVELSGKLAVAFGAQGLLRLEKSGFVPLGGQAPFGTPGGAFVDPDGKAWVSEPTASTLHHYDGTSWTKVVSPVKAPRALWGVSSSDLWLVGEDGVGYFDGKEWRRVAGPEGSFAEVVGRTTDEVWIAGASGVWRGSR